MPPRISRYIVPPTGWKYPNKNIFIYGETFDELLTNVICHRESNGYPLGNPEQEIEDYLAEQNREFVIKNL